jgi:HSP20 family molecular chaperone IbpA
MRFSLVPQFEHSRRRRDPSWVTRHRLYHHLLHDDDTSESSDEDLDFLSELEEALAPVTFVPHSNRRQSNNMQSRNRALKRFHPVAEDASSEDTSWLKKWRFEMEMDIEGFNPEELNVKLVDDCLVIEGKQEKKDPSGYISRQLLRKCTIPEGVKVDELTCKVNCKGRMVLSAPRLVDKAQPRERVIPITLVKPQNGPKAIEQEGNKAISEVSQKDTYTTGNGDAVKESNVRDAVAA